MTPYDLVDRGFYIFPIRPDNKTPYSGSWYDKTVNTRQGVDALLVEYPGCQWAVNTGYSNLTVTDIDTKDGKKGLDNWMAIKEQYGSPGDTLVVQTPSGGYHIYYRGETACSASKIGDGIDIRGVGGYVVAPGSKLPNGEYKIISDKPIPRAPEWLIDLAGKPRERGATEHIVAEEMSEAERAELVAALQHLTFDGYDSLLMRGMEIHSAYPGPDGLEIWTDWCREVYADHDDDTCTYKWSSFTHSDKGDRTIASLFHEARQNGYTGVDAATAFSGHQTQQFYIAPTLTAPTPQESANIEDDDFSDWDDIDEAAFPVREWVLKNRYIKGFLTGIIAPGGMGKSTATLIDAISICIGRDLLTGEETEQGRAWVHNAEDPLKETKGRVLALCRFFGVDRALIKGRLYVTSGRTLTLCFANKIGQGADVNWLDTQKAIDYIQQRQITVVFLDPLIRVHNVDENSNEQFDKVFKALTYIAEAQNMSVVPVHHSRKLNSADGAGDMDSARGGSVMSASCRLMFTWSRMDDKTAEDFGIDPDRKSWYVRLADAKANLAPPMDRQVWFERHSVELANGDSYGALKRAELRRVEKADPKAEENELIFRIIDDITSCDGVVRALGDVVRAVTAHRDWIYDTTEKTLHNRLGEMEVPVVTEARARITFVRDANLVPGRGSKGVVCERI